jgi:hypothetical protein
MVDAVVMTFSQVSAAVARPATRQLVEHQDSKILSPSTYF